ncbi:OLC1v1007511C1 [Oldenlandia corymbosa var. corymbosa]|uniref:OLC1v1007511C1 n=1 Tax=Oldenlandia corymbosa var. corymbosa TaxID=529605 RepID=A0AAV1DJN1_OLDCO|nr:OLC1v1007511C1 [Oldenlandia corymbosa var. corymbosa]
MDSGTSSPTHFNDDFYPGFERGLTTMGFINEAVIVACNHPPTPEIDFLEMAELSHAMDQNPVLAKFLNEHDLLLDWDDLMEAKVLAALSTNLETVNRISDDRYLCLERN